jgi:rod shape-determining protein MreB
MAEKVKIAIGSAYPLPEEQTMSMRGRNLITGLPQGIEVSSVEVREALAPSVEIIVDSVRDALDGTPPELVADLMENGIAMAGAASQLKGLSERLSQETRMQVYVSDEPMTCVARGAGRVLESLDMLRKVLTGTHRGSTRH